MPAQTPSRAAEDWVASLRRAIQCVAWSEVFGTGHMVGKRNTLYFVSSEDLPENTVAMRLKSREAILWLMVNLQYKIVHRPAEPVLSGYDVEVLRYRIEVLDSRGEELFLYHWHPDGSSHVREPHLHFAAGSFVLSPYRSRQHSLEIAIDKAHFPTGHVALQQVIRMLIEISASSRACPTGRKC